MAASKSPYDILVARHSCADPIALGHISGPVWVSRPALVSCARTPSPLAGAVLVRGLVVPFRAVLIFYTLGCMDSDSHSTTSTSPCPLITPAPSFFSGRHQRWFVAPRGIAMPVPDAPLTPTAPTPPDQMAPAPPTSRAPAHPAHAPELPNLPFPSTTPSPPPVWPVSLPPTHAAAAAPPLRAAAAPPPAVELPAALAVALPRASSAVVLPPTAADVPLVPTAAPLPPPTVGMFPPGLHGVEQLIRALPAGCRSFLSVPSFACVLRAVAAGFPVDGQLAPVRAVPKDCHAADVLAAGFPMVPLEAVPQALAVAAVAEALAVALPANEGVSPLWLEAMAQVGMAHPLSPAVPWMVAYVCRPDDGGPVARAKAARCPYWTSAASRVTVYYSAERLANLGATILREMPDPGRVFQHREAALRSRLSHGCFSAVGLSAMYGKELFAPDGCIRDHQRPLWLSFLLMVSLRHFAQTVALRAAPCEQHDEAMGADLVMVTHQLFR